MAIGLSSGECEQNNAEGNQQRGIPQANWVCVGPRRRALLLGNCFLGSLVVLALDVARERGVRGADKSHTRPSREASFVPHPTWPKKWPRLACPLRLEADIGFATPCSIPMRKLDVERLHVGVQSSILHRQDDDWRRSCFLGGFVGLA